MCLSYRAKPIMAHFGPKMEPDFEAQNRPARKSAIFAKIGRFCPTLAEIGRLLGDFQAERHRQSARARLSSLRNIRTSSLVDETSTCLKSGGDSSSGDYGAFLSEMNSPQSATPGSQKARWRQCGSEFCENCTLCTPLYCHASPN